MARITLLTDFGTADGYVGAMKGVIAGIAPSCVVDDISHDIPRGDVRAAAWALAAYAFRFPPGTVHLAVVDPGVGTARRPLAARIDGRFFVAPDNGLLTRVLRAGAHVVEMTERRYRAGHISFTFHGRDVFAPAAAHLACGTSVLVLGPAVDDARRLDLAAPRRTDHTVHGEVVHVDRFGNLITNVPAGDAAAGAAVRIGGRAARRVDTYGEGEPGELLALVGSAGVLEVAVRDGSAADVLGAACGDAVTVDAAG